MRTLSLVLVVALYLGAAEAQAPPVNVSVVAVQASKEDRAEPMFDAGLDSVRDALKDLPYDTFKKLASTNVSAPFEKDTSVTLTSKYTLYVTPSSKEENGQIRMTLRVEMPSKDPQGKPVNVLSTTVSATPGKQLVLRGLKLDAGEGVVVIAIKA